MSNHNATLRIVPKYMHPDGEIELYPSNPSMWSLESRTLDGLWYVVRDYSAFEAALAAYLNHMECHYVR